MADNDEGESDERDGVRRERQGHQADEAIVQRRHDVLVRVRVVGARVFVRGQRAQLVVREVRAVEAACGLREAAARGGGAPRRRVLSREESGGDRDGHSARNRHGAEGGAGGWWWARGRVCGY